MTDTATFLREHTSHRLGLLSNGWAIQVYCEACSTSEIIEIIELVSLGSERPLDSTV